MSAATAIAPAKVDAPTIITNHIYHRACNPPKGERMAYCGHKAKPTSDFVPWNPLDASPQDCSMCLEARNTFGCPKCGVKP